MEEHCYFARNRSSGSNQAVTYTLVGLVSPIPTKVSHDERHDLGHNLLEHRHSCHLALCPKITSVTFRCTRCGQLSLHTRMQFLLWVLFPHGTHQLRTAAR